MGKWAFQLLQLRLFFFLQSKENERKSTIFKPSSSMLLTPLTALPFSTFHNLTGHLHPSDSHPSKSLRSHSRRPAACPVCMDQPLLTNWLDHAGVFRVWLLSQYSSSLSMLWQVVELHFFLWLRECIVNNFFIRSFLEDLTCFYFLTLGNSIL